MICMHECLQMRFILFANWVVTKPVLPKEFTNIWCKKIIFIFLDAKNGENPSVVGFTREPDSNGFWPPNVLVQPPRSTPTVCTAGSVRAFHPTVVENRPVQWGCLLM